MKYKRVRLKKEHTSKLEVFLNEDHNDENLINLIDLKIQLNWEIEKDEVFWE